MWSGNYPAEVSQALDTQRLTGLSSTCAPEVLSAREPEANP